MQIEHNERNGKREWFQMHENVAWDLIEIMFYMGEDSLHF